MEGHPQVAVGARIWVRDARGEEVWLRGEVVEPGSYRLCDSADESALAIPNEFLICNDGADDVDDLTQLTHLHEASLLESLQKRFDVDSIYTYTGPILIAVNPFKRISGLYDQQVLDDFITHAQQTTTYLQSQRSPHVFAVALEAYRGLCEFEKNQTVLISGESGAGKTESTKFVMKLLALAGTSNTSGAASGGAAKPHPPLQHKLSSHITRTSSLHPAQETTTIDLCEAAAPVAPVVATSSVENQVLQSNPLLEAFGNAKTLRNDNSSRFGKFIEMEFEVNSTTHLGRLCGARIHTYLLETVRVCRQLLNERNFHAFYQLSAAVAEAQKCGGKIEVIPPGVGPDDAPALEYDLSMFDDLLSNRYVSCSGCVSLPGLDELAEFRQTCIAMLTVKIEAAEQVEMWKLVGAILLLGSVYFYSASRQSENCEIDPSMLGVLAQVAELLGIPSIEALKKCLTSRTIVVQKETYTKGLTLDQAEDARDALARALYHTLFQRIVAATNQSIQGGAPAGGHQYERVAQVSCGVLDIFGFECFEVNSFEQLCINYTNERLQSFFNNYIFSCEEKLYRAEQIQWDTLDFPDNQDCVDLIGVTSASTGNKICLLSLLDEECVIPKGNDLALCNKYKSNFKKHARFREIKTRQDWFVVTHFAGNVSYCIKGFIDKNKDQLGLDIQECIKSSTNAFVSNLFYTHLDREPAPAATEGRVLAKKKLLTVSLEFRNQLNTLMDTISRTEPHFVRCVKPNPQNKANLFNRKAVAEQLRYAGVLQAVQVSRAGYPVRDSHRQFWLLYNCLLPSQIRFQLLAKYGADVTDNSRVATTAASSAASSPSEDGLATADPLRERALETLNILNDQLNIPVAKHSLGKSWAVGRSLVFLKHEAFEVLSTRRAEARHAAARVVQAHWLGSRTRKWYRAAHAAILTIQCAIRSAQARAKATALRRYNAAFTIGRIVRGFLVRRALRKKHRAAAVIQRRIRGAHARAYVRDLKRHRAATRIQTALRAHRARVWYSKVTSAITAIQLRWKRRCAQRQLVKLRLEAKSTSNLQSKITELQREVQELRARCDELATNSQTFKMLAEEASGRNEQLEAALAELALAEPEQQAPSAHEEDTPVGSEVSPEAATPVEPVAVAVAAAPATATPVISEVAATALEETPAAERLSEEEVARRVEEEVNTRLLAAQAEHEKEVEMLQQEVERLRATSPDMVTPFSSVPAGGADGVEGNELLVSPEPKASQSLGKELDEEGLEATTRSGTPSSPLEEPEHMWMQEKDQLLAEMQSLREDLTAARDALDVKAGGSEDYLECVLNVLGSPRVAGGSPSEREAEPYSLFSDVLFVTPQPEELARLLLKLMRSQLSWDEVNIERLTSMSAGVSSVAKPIEFLFPHISITSLKAVILSPAEITQFVENAPHPRVLKSLRAAIFYPDLISAEDASMKEAWDCLGLSVNRVLLVDEGGDGQRHSPSLEICSNTFGVVVTESRLSSLLASLCDVVTKNRIHLVKDLQDLKDTLKSKALLSKSKSSRPSPVSELMSLIPTIFTGGGLRTGSRVPLPPGMSAKNQGAPPPFLEPTLGLSISSKTPLITAWQDLRVPNGAAVTSVCFAPIEKTREFHLLCAATKSGLIYTYKVPLTPQEKEKVDKITFAESEAYPDSDWLQAPTSTRLWRILEGHERAVTSMFFSREGDYLITTSVDCSVRFWDYVQGYPAKIFSDSVPILTARIMPTNPKCFFTSNSKSVVRLVNSEEGQVIQRMKVDSEIRAVCFDSSGLNMLAGTKDGCIATYEVAEDTKLRFIDKVNINGAGGNSGRSAVTCVQFVRGNPPHLVINLSDNHIVICGVYYGLTNCCVSQVILKKRIKNPHSCLPLATCLIRRDESSVCVSASEDSKLKVMSSAADFEVVEELKGHTCATLSVGCTPNKTVLASADVSGFIKLWRS